MPDIETTAAWGCNVTCTGENRTCNASDDCVCIPGYGVASGEVDDSDRPCTDIDECIDECKAEGQNCSNTEGSYACGCSEGYVEDRDFCVKVCPKPCPANSECDNSNPDDGCVCDKGYGNYTSESGCIDIDECMNDIDNCNGTHQTCDNTEGSFSCGCEEGYSYQDDGFTCEKLCPPSCPDNSRCTAATAEDGCVCNDGYEDYDEKDGCKDIVECDLDGYCNESGQECINVPGSFHCVCASGFYLDEDGVCMEEPAQCPDCSEKPHSSCKDPTEGCECDPGYAEQDGSCVDINECLTFTLEPTFQCANTEGSYCCTCIVGYQTSKDDDACSCDATCVPINCPASNYSCPGDLCSGYIAFPATLAGYSTASNNRCADNTTNAGKVYGTRSCSLQGQWAPPVLLSSCGDGIQQLTEKPIETEEERVEASTQLEVLTEDPDQLESEDITSSTEVIGNVTSAENLTTTVATSVVSSISNIMESPSLASSGQTETLLAQIDDVASKVILNGSIPYQAISKNISLFIAEAKDTNVEGVGIAVLVRPNTTSDGFREDSIQPSDGSASAGGILSENQVQASIHVPTAALGKSSRVSIYAFGNNNLFPAKNSSTAGFVSGSPVSSNATLNSLVLSATVENETITGLPSGQRLTYSTPRDNTSTGDVPVCAYWNEDAGQWFTDGCEVDESKTTTTAIACTCDHLTNFATLLDIGGVTTAIYALDVITIVGSSISSVALLLVVGVFIFFPATRRGRKFRPSFLLLNLSIALLGLNMTLLVSEMPFLTNPVNRDIYKPSCIAVAAIIHFFMLCSCAWMNGEAAVMFLAVTKPLYVRCELQDKNVVIISSLWGWLMPAVFVSIVLGVDTDVYLYPYEESDPEVTCWITNDMIVYLAVIPVAIMMGGNLVVYAILTYKLCRNTHSNWGATWRSTRDSQRKKTAVNICLVITLGLTWVFGFFVAGISDETATIVFAYIFSILNSLQGLFLFIIYIVRNKETRGTIARGISSITGTIGFSSSTSKPANTRSSQSRTFESGWSHDPYEIQSASLRSRLPTRGRRSSSLSDISLSDFAMPPRNGNNSGNRTQL